VFTNQLGNSSAATMIKLLNQSLACPRLMKIKTLILASLLVGALSDGFSPLQAADHHKMIDRATRRHFRDPALGPYKPVHRNQSSIAKTLDCCR